MLRTVARAANATRPLSIMRNAAPRPRRDFVSSASRTSVRRQIPKFHRDIPLARHFSTVPGDNQAADPPQKPAPEDISWINILETPAKAEWLTKRPTDHRDRLNRSYSLLFHIILYLGRPLTSDAKEAESIAHQFLLAFNSASVSVDSEIGRARYAIALLTKTITDDITTIPDSAQIRTPHPQIFALASALVPLCEVYLGGLVQGSVPTSGEVVEEGRWQDFWAKAQPVVLALGEELEKEGYGIDEDLMKQAMAEQQRKDSEAASTTKENK